MYLMSFFFVTFFIKKKMSQNVWATIMPFGPVTLNVLLAQKKIFLGSQRLALISATGLLFSLSNKYSLQKFEKET